MIHISNEEAFKKYIKSTDKKILIDFWAAWCGPCVALGKTLEELNKEKAKDFEIAKVDIEENTDLAAQHRIRNIPFMAVYKNGEMVDSRTGNMSASAIKEWLDGIK